MDEKAWSDLYNRIESFLKLEKDWDSYGGEAPPYFIIIKSLLFLGILKNLNFESVLVCPTSDDSILFQIKKGGISQEWDFYFEGEVAAVCKYKNTRCCFDMLYPVQAEILLILNISFYEKPV